mgnify:CR=1 FL=1
MTDLELDAVAEGLFKYLLTQTETPLDAIAVLGMTLLKVFKAGSDGTIPIATFAKDFEKSLIESFNSASAQGTETRQ